MNKLNPLLLAMNDIDDNIAANAIKKKRVRPITLTIAAAAAAVLLFTGFQSLTRFKSRYDRGATGVFIYNYHQFCYNLTDKRLNIPAKDELLKTGAVEVFEDGDGYSVLFEDALPSDILKLCNAQPITLGNDNFTEQPGEVRIEYISLNNGQNTHMQFNYSLTHKKSGVILDFNCEVSIKDHDTLMEYHGCKPDDRELISLNDNSMCLLLEHRHNEDLVNSIADFSYDGVIYRIDTPYLNVDKERMKEVLFDLGVL